MKIKRLFFFLFLLNISSLLGAMPFTHVYLAEKWISSKENFTDAEKQAFVLGTLLPDIRYLGTVSREKTHLSHVKIADISKAASPFEKGFKFHSFIDEKRESLVRKWKIYELLPNISVDHVYTFLEILEDEILYKKVSKDQISQYLQSFDSEEFQCDISLDMIRMWHILLVQYFQSSPSYLLKKFSQFHQGYMGISSEEIQTWSVLLPVLAENEKMKHYVADLLAEFDTCFKK